MTFEEYYGYIVDAWMPFRRAEIADRQKAPGSGVRQAPVKRPLSREERFLVTMMDGLSEIETTLDVFADTELYLRRFPFARTSLTHGRYLLYHVQTHLHEVYILKERLKAHATQVARAYRHSPAATRAASVCAAFHKLVEATLQPVSATRGTHVHSERFIDPDIASLLKLESIMKYLPNEQEHRRLHRSQYRDTKKKWLAIVVTNRREVGRLADLAAEGVGSLVVAPNHSIRYPWRLASK
jgi:hypothetical protein